MAQQTHEIGNPTQYAVRCRYNRHIEDVLSECFKFHRELDLFLARSGVSEIQLARARLAAEQEAAGGRFAKAPKRFVVQAVLNELAAAGDAGDRVCSNLVTGLLSMTFVHASPAGIEALERLKAKADKDRAERAEQRRAEQDERVRVQRDAERQQEAARRRRDTERDHLRYRFLELMREDNAQKRGYALESFLRDLFDFEKLEPRESFRITGEQIDGSFLWRSRTYLLEAKWVKSPVAGAEFGAFSYKIQGKTADTRGLYISINGYSPEAIAGMNAKGALKFVCIDGAHIMRSLIGDESLTSILERIWRHADETGEAYLPVIKM